MALSRNVDDSDAAIGSAAPARFHGVDDLPSKCHAQLWDHCGTSSSCCNAGNSRSCHSKYVAPLCCMIRSLQVGSRLDPEQFSQRNSIYITSRRPSISSEDTRSHFDKPPITVIFQPSPSSWMRFMIVTRPWCKQQPQSFPQRGQYKKEDTGSICGTGVLIALSFPAVSWRTARAHGAAPRPCGRSP